MRIGIGTPRRFTPEGSGNTFTLEVDVGQMPISFYRAVEDTVFEALKAGLYGWQVIDCHVAVTALERSSPSRQLIFEA